MKIKTIITNNFKTDLTTLTYAKLTKIIDACDDLYDTELYSRQIEELAERCDVELMSRGEEE